MTIQHPSEAIKRLIKQAAASPLGWRLGAQLLGNRGVCVLMYHRVTRHDDAFPGMNVDVFVRQMRWLRRNCTPIAPDAFAASLDAPPERPPVLVTFDDGFRCFHDNAYPVLAELGIPSLVFLATSFIDAGGLIWTDAVNWAIRRSRCTSVRLPWDRGTELPLGDDPERERLAGICKGVLKVMPDAQREAFQEALFEELRVDPQDGSAGRQMLNWDEVRATRRFTTFGGHTHTHPILSRVDAARADLEIRTCNERIVAETGVAPRYFAYPNGGPEDYTAETVEILRRHGYELAFTRVEGLHTRGMDPFSVRRQPTGGSRVSDFAWLVSGRGG